MATAPFCVVGRERAPNIAVLPGKSGQNLGNLFPRRTGRAGAGVAVRPHRQKILLKKSLLTDVMVPISDGVSLVKGWTGLAHEDVVNYVAQWILKTDLRVETFGQDEKFVRIDAEQRDKTRIVDGKIEIDDGSKIVRLTWIDSYSETSHPDRVPAATKTTAKAGTEATVSWLGLWDLVGKYINAGVIEERPARSRAGLRPGPKLKYKHQEICAAFAYACSYGKAINEQNQSKVIQEVRECLTQYYGYDEEYMPGTTMLKDFASVVMKLFLEVDEKDE